MMMDGKSRQRPGILVRAAGRQSLGQGSSFADLFRQTFSTVKSIPNIGSTSPRSLHVLNSGGLKSVPNQESTSPRIPHVLISEGNDIVNGRMSSPPKRHLADIRNSSLAPSQHGRRDKQLYGSAGDITSTSRSISELDTSTNENNNGPKKPADKLPSDGDPSESNDDTVPLSAVRFPQTTASQPFVENESSLNDDSLNKPDNKGPSSIEEQAKAEAVSSFEDSKTTDTNTDNSDVPEENFDTKCSQVNRYDDINVKDDETGNGFVDKRNLPGVKSIVEAFIRKMKTISNSSDIEKATLKNIDKDPKYVDVDTGNDDTDLDKIWEVTDRIKASDNVVLDETSMISKADVIKDMEGAVGGREIHGILQSSSSDIPQKKSSSVQFNDEVTVELFSQTDPTASSTTKAALAQGDGPSPATSLRLSSITSLNESSFMSDTPSMQSDIAEIEILSERGQSPSELIDFQSASKSKEKLKRKDSMPKLLSPAALLREKQKLAASSQMSNSSSSKGFESAIHDYTDSVILQNPESDVRRPRSPSEDEFPLPFDENIHMPQVQNQHEQSNTCSVSSMEPFVSHEKLIDSKLSEKILSPEFKSREENFSLSGYNLTNYMISYPELSRKNSSDNPLTENHQRSFNKEQADCISEGTGSFSYTSPSKLHQKVSDRERADENVPEIGSFSYASPSELHQKISDRESAEKNTPGIIFFSYTSPSKLYQKISDSERAAENSPGFGSLSYTSPSKLYQKISDRERAAENSPRFGSFSYTSPPNLQLKISDNERAKSKEGGHIDSYRKIIIQNLRDMPYADLDDFEPIEEESKHWRKRCERKLHLDNLRSWTHANSQSDVLLRKVLSNAGSIGSAENFNTEQKDKLIFDDKFATREDKNLQVADLNDDNIAPKTDGKARGISKGNFDNETGQEVVVNNGWQKRCKRKERLDNIQRWTQDHSQSDVLLKKTLSDESNSLIENYDGYVSDPEMNVFDKDKDVLFEDTGNDLHSSLENINQCLLQFLLNIKEKHINDIPIMHEDFKELMLLQAFMCEISNRMEETENQTGELETDATIEANISQQNHDMIFFNNMRKQLNWARTMLNNACSNMAGNQSDVEINSVDSIGSGYLGETDLNGEETEGHVDNTAFPQESDCMFKREPSETGYLGDVEKEDIMINDTRGFSDKLRNIKYERLKENKVKDKKGETSSSDISVKGCQETAHDIVEKTRISKSESESKADKENNEDNSVTDDSLAVNAPENDKRSLDVSPRMVKILTCFEYPSDTKDVEVDIGSSYVKLGTEGWYSLDEQQEGIYPKELEQHSSLMEGSPDRVQRLFGSSQNLERREHGGAGKRKQASRSMTPDSRFMLDKEVTESQNRKLQTEVATLQTENRLLKEKYTRAQGRISDLETQLAEAQDDLANLQESLNQEVSELSTRTKQEISRDRDNLDARILALSKENETFKQEISSLEKRLESSHRATDMARHNSEKSRTLEAHKSEITSLKEELSRVKALLEQSERHLWDEEERHAATSKEIVKLTELKNALQQQADTGGIAATTDKQLKSLEKRLKITEERLHQERADRANNLSAVEDKLLTENAKLQASEKELGRQLHREKEKNRNFEQRVKQLREENEKLRLAMPFDDTTLLSNKENYDIPYSSHSNQRAETIKHISDDMNYILSQIEKQDGLQSSDDTEIIRTLWNKRELAYRQLREYDLQFQELHITDNNIADGLKNLRDTYGQAELKLRDMEECVEDARVQMSTLDATYKQQQSVLVAERHEAFARLKTAEDLLEAIRAENEVLHHSLSIGQTAVGQSHSGDHFGKSPDALQVEMTQLESKVSQLTRANQMMEAELKTIRVQLDARDKALKDVQTELDLAYSRLKGDDSEDRKQEKIDKLSAQMSSLQVELKLITDKYTSMSSENTKLESEISSLRKQSGSQKTKQLKSEQTDNKVIQQLKESIEERDSKLTSLTKQLDDLENQLQKTRQDLYIEQMHTEELESENENLQQTVGQRAQMFESLSGSEREQLAQYQILKETLDSVSQELAQKHAQIISLDVNLSGARDSCLELEEEVRRLRKMNSGDDQEQEGAYTEDEQSSAHQLKIKELEKERSLLKQELEQAYSAIQASEEQYRTLQTESAQLEQELVKEKTVILQITAEKGEMEQHLEELAEEHESLIQEKTQAEEDLIKLETKLQEILQKYETQARKQHNDFESEYPGLPPEAKKLVSEMETLTLIVDGKDREISMLNDKINRQHIEIEFLHRKVELVHNDSIANREDIARMISELTLKMKEAVSTREVNQFLVGERTKLQNEKSHLEKELEIERKNNDERKVEIQDVIRKIERTETTQKSTEKDSRNKDNAILTLESDLRNTRNNLAGMESEVTMLRNKVDKLNEDLKNLTGINGSLEKRLEMEKNSLAEEKNSVSKWMEDYKVLSHDFEVLQHDHTILCDKFQSELEMVDKLKRELEDKEEELSSMKDELSNTKVELDSNKGQLLITKDTVQKLTQDKGSIYQDYEGMCRSLTEKERQLTELRERTDEKIEHLKREHTQEKLRLEQDRAAAVQERDMAKKGMDNINEQLKQKEIQLNTFGKTLQELESVTREKRQLEAHVQKLESSTEDSKVLLDGQRKEMMALNEALAKLQERNTRLEAENHTIHADLKAQKEAGNREARELNITINELKSQHENERHYLNDNLSQTQTRLRSVEASLASAASERDALQGKCRLLENTIEELQAKLSDESTGRRLAEQSVGTLRLQLEDMKNDKNITEARFVEMRNQVKKAEEKLKIEEEKCVATSAQLQELNAISHTNRSTVKAKSEQVEMLQKEISNLKQIIETQKQNLNGKIKKSALEYKQQIENIEEERDKLQLLNQQLSTDLDSCREHIASKNKENLKLQEEILVLEDNVRECKVKQKHAEDTLKIEADKQTELLARFEAQEEELKRLRNFLARKVEQSGDSDKTMWQEMNRVIQDLSRQMTTHLDSTRGGDKEKSPESLVSRLRKQVAEVQGELSTEKSLHQITKTSLVALEEDCQRLRKQLHHYRRRDPPSGEKKHKNRMEAINAIIARSQSQAQALLSSGGYFDDNMVSPRVRSHQASPRVGFHTPQHHEVSPDNSYSEDLSVASLPPMHYGLPSTKS